MKLSSLDIRKQEYSRVWRGCDPDEVDAFQQLIADQLQALADDLRRSEEKVKDHQLKLDHYMRVEEALEEALQTARSGARQTIENAERKAKNITEDAERNSVEIAREAEADRLNVKRDTAKYSVRQKEIVAKMRAFLMSELEILAQYDAEDPSGYVRMIPAATETPAQLVHSEPEVDSDQEEEEEGAGESGPSFVFDGDEIEDPYDEIEAPDILAGDRPAWTVNPVVSPNDAGDESAATDEIKKIRRILEDLEKQD